MRLKPDQLAASLNKGLAPVYVISGDEPLQLLECADLIRDRARREGAGDRTVLEVSRYFDWNTLFSAGANLSLFANRNLIELRLGTQKPGIEGARALTEFAGSGNQDTTLLITAAKQDKQAQSSKWYKALDAAGVTIQVWPLKPAELPGWIAGRARALGRTIQVDAARLIAQNAEGNLLAARQEIEKLCLLVESGDISVNHVMAAVNDNSKYDVFGLIETALMGNSEHAIRMVRGLQGEGMEPRGFFNPLMWELRRTCSIAAAIQSGQSRQAVFAEYRVFDTRKPALVRILDRMKYPQFKDLLVQAGLIDRSLKGAERRDPWELMERFLLQLSGQPL